MYRVTIRQGWTGEEKVVHSEYINDLKLLNGKITKDIDSIPSFVFSISRKSEFYNSLTPWTTFIKVKNTRLNKVLFEGRVLPFDDEMDSSGTLVKEVTCEGLLSFLQDSIQDYYALSDNKLVPFLQHMIDVHNGQVEDFKKIKLGAVTVVSPSDNVYKSIDDSKSTYDSIKEKLIDKYDGELQLRHESDGLYLDYLTQVGSTANQEIRLASNLISLKRAVDPSNAYSIIKPLGETQDTDTISTSDDDSDISKPRLTIETVNNSSPFLYSQDLINQIGKVCKAVIWDDVTDASILKTKGQAELDSQKAITTQYQVSAVDLSLIKGNSSVDSFEVGNTHHVYNPVQGIDDNLRIVGQIIDICEPLNSTLSIGEKLLSQEDYAIQTEKQVEEITNLNDKLKSQNQKIVTLNTDLTNANKTISTLTTDYSSLSDTVKEILANNDVWVPGNIFVDLSGNNGASSSTDQAASWYTNLASLGVKGAMIKLTEGSASGTDYVNPLFASQKANVIAAGMKYVGAYHFFRAASVDDATAEGEFFLTQLQANSIATSTIVACDVELSSLDPTAVGATLTKADLEARIAAFYKVLIDAGYTNTCDYASSSRFGTWFDQQGKYAWKADWDANSKPDGADAWQYTNGFNGLSLDASKSYSKAFI